MTFPVTRQLLRADGSLPQYTSAGGDTILYVVKGTDTCLCAWCATAAYHAGMALECATYDEGPALECEGESLTVERDGETVALVEECDAEIESSYGDPDGEP